LCVLCIIFGEEQNIPKHLTVQISPVLLISYRVQIFPQRCVLKCSKCCNSLCEYGWKCSCTAVCHTSLFCKQHWPCENMSCAGVMLFVSITT
jgi:hypothetical protein